MSDQCHVPQAIATNNNNFNSNMHSDDDDDDLKLNLQIPLKLELKIEQMDSDKHEHEHDHEEEEDNEEKQSMIIPQSSLSKPPPLAVPMVADTSHHSVTRNDAKQITDSRLKRLKILSQKPENSLSKPQKDEKKRIIRLEKNRRAAAMSRRKKKLYVKSLENKNKLMERHIAILEMENAQLRTLMTHHHAHPMMNTLNGFKMQQQQNTHFPAYKLPVPPTLPLSTRSNSNSFATTSMNSIEPSLPSTDVSSSNNSVKRRKLNDGTSMNTSTSPGSGSPSHGDHDLSDMDVLEPLPVGGGGVSGNNNDNNKENQPPMQYMANMNHLIPPPSMNCNMNMHHPSARLYHPSPYVQNLGLMQQHLYPMPSAYHQQMQMQQQQQQKSVNRVEGIVIDKDVNESKSEECVNENNDVPPEIDIPRLRLSGEFMTLLDEEIIVDETVDECGSIIQFEHDTKENKLFL